MNLENQFSEYNSEVSKELPSYSGLLGLSIGGSRTVNISTRAGFVYVRLRDNLNEVVQAYNDKVSPVYDLPVLIQRVGNRWHVIGKDTSRYDVWGTSAPFLPAHAGQHEFNRAIGSGGDAVFVYDDQFMPLLVYPSGTSGAGMLMVAPYVLQRNADFIYVGNTGTGNLLIYKPTDNQAIMGLVVLNKTTGNPEVLIASGTPFSGVVTGTHQVIPYLAYPASHQEPLYGFRLVSGTTALRWENLYNVRQFIGGNQSTGTSSSLPSFITGSVPFAGADGNLTENNPYLRWKNSNHQLFIGKPEADQFDFDDTYPLVLTSNSANNAIAMSVVTYGTGTSGGPSPSYVAWRSRGTFEARTPVQKDDALLTLSALGWDGAGWANQSRIRFYANQNWITGSVLPTRMDFDITPSGSATRRTQFQVYGDSVNVPTGSTYNIGGTPHTHDYEPIDGWITFPYTVNYASADSPSFVINIQGNVTGSFAPGTKFRFSHLGATKYFIQTGLPTWVSGSYTSMNLYGGTDYTLTTGTISSPYYSRDRAPQGFPLSPSKWTQEYTDTSVRSQASPVAGTKYNPGSMSLVIPIGDWDVEYMAVLDGVKLAATVAEAICSLSTSTSSETDADLRGYVYITGASATIDAINTIYRRKDIQITSKTTYYLIIWTNTASMTSISIDGNQAKTIIRARCNYL